MDNNEVTLKQYVDQRFADSDKAVGAALASLDKRLDSVNEFRASLKDQQSTYLTRETYEAAHRDLFNQITQLNSRMDKRDGEKTGATDVWGYIVAAFATGGIVVDLILRALGK